MKQDVLCSSSSSSSSGRSSSSNNSDSSSSTGCYYYYSASIALHCTFSYCICLSLFISINLICLSTKTQNI